MAVVDQHKFDLLERKVEDLTRQLMLTELAMGERARSEADSGIKQVRSTKDATKPYYLTTHTYNSEQYFSYIVEVSFIGRGKRRKLPTCRK
jgi:hypothetical protein